MESRVIRRDEVHAIVNICLENEGLLQNSRRLYDSLGLPPAQYHEIKIRNDASGPYESFSLIFANWIESKGTKKANLASLISILRCMKYVLTAERIEEHFSTSDQVARNLQAHADSSQQSKHKKCETINKNTAIQKPNPTSSTHQKPNTLPKNMNDDMNAGNDSSKFNLQVSGITARMDNVQLENDLKKHSTFAGGRLEIISGGQAFISYKNQIKLECALKHFSEQKGMEVCGRRLNVSLCNKLPK